METEKIRLTKLAKGSGCGCKISPAVLEDLLHGQRSDIANNLLVGNNSNDDAAVYDMGNGQALIITADFFTPVVDDPYTFGQVAAANAISDVYAMGGKPITAIALMGWPIDAVPVAHAARVLEGARALCAKAGIVISGGHTIDAPEPFFGLSVNGLAPIANIKRNNGAQSGDLIMMTKAIGTGVLAAATKRDQIQPEHEALLIEQLIQINSGGEWFGKERAVHAMTDITGYGLLGHLIEMCEGSTLTAAIEFEKVPLIPSAADYARMGVLPDATYRNWNACSEKVHIDPAADALLSFTLLADPQTNGGLLLAVDPKCKSQLLELANKLNIQLSTIGVFQAKGEKAVLVNK